MQYTIQLIENNTEINIARNEDRTLTELVNYAGYFLTDVRFTSNQLGHTPGPIG